MFFPGDTSYAISLSPGREHHTPNLVIYSEVKNEFMVCWVESPRHQKMQSMPPHPSKQFHNSAIIYRVEVH